jgi:hypothetical protein
MSSSPHMPGHYEPESSPSHCEPESLPSHCEPESSALPSTTLIAGALRHTPSKESISNFSADSTAAANYKDPIRLPGQDPIPPISQNSPESPPRDCSSISSIPDRKSCHSLQKLTLRVRNDSRSTACTVLEIESDDCYFTAPSTPERDLSPCCSSGLPSPEDQPSSFGRLTSPSSSPANTADIPVSHSSGDLLTSRTTKVTIEYHKPSMRVIREYEELLSNINRQAAAAACPKDVTRLHAVRRSSTRPQRETVQYHKPSRQTIQKVRELLSSASGDVHAATTTNHRGHRPSIHSRQASLLPNSCQCHASQPSRRPDTPDPRSSLDRRYRPHPSQ